MALTAQLQLHVMKIGFMKSGLFEKYLVLKLDNLAGNRSGLMSIYVYLVSWGQCDLGYDNKRSNIGQP